MIGAGDGVSREMGEVGLGRMVGCRSIKSLSFCRSDKGSPMSDTLEKLAYSPSSLLSLARGRLPLADTRSRTAVSRTRAAESH
jgi:hypothetical protein